MNRYTNALRRHFTEKSLEPFCRQVGKDGETLITWGDLAKGCGGFRAAYAREGLNAGDQVLIFLRHVPALYPAFFGAMLSGITPAFMPCASPRQDPGLYWSSHQLLLDRISPAAIVTDRATHAEMLGAGLSLGDSRLILADDVGEGALIEFDAPEDSIGLLQHSSGTTGLKKGVALSFRAISDQVESYGRMLGVSDQDKIVSWLPLYHDMGLIACMILPAFFGVSTVHIDPFYWIGRPHVLFDYIQSEKGTYCWLPNFAFEHLATIVGPKAANYDVSSIRAFINCSEPCKPFTFDRFLERLEPAGVKSEQLQCCYAMAEAVYAVSQTPIGALPHRRTVNPDTLDRGCVPSAPEAGGKSVEVIETGALVPGIGVEIVDENRQPVQDGAVGEIVLSGPFLFSGYNKDVERTQKQLVDGRYHSRDLGFMADGRLYVLGRIDDLVIINGRNLYAHEIEAELAKVAGLKPGRAVAVGAFEEQVGSSVLIVIAERMPGGNVPDAQLRRAVMDTIQSIFEVSPHAVELLDEGGLIKTTSGKISRDKNLERYRERRAARIASR
jgi:acyl-CoA synthetase (AMP-forming)/AMP-acid ligase II